MSLDVYLEVEVDTGGESPHVVELFSANITHNLNVMADAAGIYGALWRPDENGIETAGQLIEPIAEGIRVLRSDPERFRTYEPENKWGTYDNFVPWLEKYLEACKAHPKAKVRTWR